MTTYILIPCAAMSAFRPRYLEITGETVQDDPPTDGVSFLIGSSRVTPGQADILTAEFPEISVFPNAPPPFVPLEDNPV